MSSRRTRADAKRLAEASANKDTTTLSSVNNMADMGSIDAVSESVQRCRLLELPAELRIAIYSFVLQQHNTIVVRGLMHLETPPLLVTSHSHSPRGKYSPLGIGTNILASCKQIRVEATPLLYSINSFWLWSSIGAVRFVKIVNTSAAHLRNVTLDARNSQKDSAADIRAIKNSGAMLSRLSFDAQYRRQFTPEKMALALRPIARALDKQRRVDDERKSSCVLDRLSFLGFRPWEEETNPRSSANVAAHEQRAKADEQAAKAYEDKVKSLLRPLLKQA